MNKYLWAPLLSVGAADQVSKLTFQNFSIVKTYSKFLILIIIPWIGELGLEKNKEFTKLGLLYNFNYLSLTIIIRSNKINKNLQIYLQKYAIYF